jgi:hypothetical protein
VIIVDDPIKSREEANSAAYRDRVFSWWTDDLYTRLEPGAVIILILTRWHMDDLAGRTIFGALNVANGDQVFETRFDLLEIDDVATDLSQGFVSQRYKFWRLGHDA